ncbi:MAG: helicase-exonuclease AddAB subunit AddA [Oscillospiraceae bacterium]
MSKMQWTAQQEDAIKTRDKTLLLSAAAGSGKTAVLVERIAGLLLDKERPIGADELVVVTFSNAAAAEMKQRLVKRLFNEEKENPSNQMLKQQLRLLKQAKISTVHAFCYDLIRENFFELGLPADIHIADEREMQILFQESLSRAIEQNYDKNNEDFFNLVDMLSVGRDDKKLRETVETLYKFIRSYPFYTSWLDKRLKDFDNVDSPENSVWGEIIIEYAESIFKYAVQILQGAIAIANNDSYVMEKYNPLLQEELSQAQNLVLLAKEKNWEGIYESLSELRFSTLPRIPKEANPEIKNLAQAQRNLTKKVLTDIAKKNLFCEAEDFLSDNTYMKGLIAGIFSLTKDLDNQFSKDKLERKLLDFSDLEHFALKLLVSEKNDDYKFSNLAKTLSQTYKEVLVDEYQDTNMIQDLIFKAVSDEGKNLFMVGDVKQSIYGFRQAMPEIFLNKKQTFKLLSDNADTAKIILSKNFRSRKEVTDGINFIFKQIMSEEVGGLDYGEEEQLVVGALYPEANDRGCELAVIDLGSIDEEDLSSREIEANYIADRIKQLIDSGYEVLGKNGMRKIEPYDIAILLRSANNKAPIYQNALKKIGLDGDYSPDSGFLSSIEVSCVISLLKAIDNPLLDIDLFGAMMSPLFDFSADDMAKLSAKRTDKPLFLRLMENYPHSEKAKNFLELFSELRAFSATTNTAELIYKIYDMTGFETIVRVMKNGKTKSLNLKLLADYAAEFDANGYKGLSAFVRFINKLDESGGDLSPAIISETGDNSIKIMSIHRSKGLEFPVVFLADSSKKFNTTDLRATSMLHSKLGFASMRRDNELGIQYKTTHLNAVSIQSEKDLLSEEMRVLYVALTRAKEKLIIVASISNLANNVKGLNIPINSDKKLPSGLVKSKMSYSSWIISALLHHEYATPLLNIGETEALGTIENCGKFQITIETNLQKNQEKLLENKENELLPSEETVSIFKEREKFVYPFEAETKTPTKLAISSIGKEENFADKFSMRPKFLREEQMTGAEKGSATHKFMQFARYEKLADDMENELERLVEFEFLSREEADNVDTKKIKILSQSKLFERIMCADKVLREYSFLAEVSEKELAQYTDKIKENAVVAVQGIADCIIIENGKATVIDYKTDFAKAEDELISKYATQLNLYKLLLKESLNCEVSQSIIYSFSLGREINV